MKSITGTTNNFKNNVVLLRYAIFITINIIIVISLTSVHGFTGGSKNTAFIHTSRRIRINNPTLTRTIVPLAAGCESSDCTSTTSSSSNNDATGSSSTTTTTTNNNDNNSVHKPVMRQPEILKPFLEATDPNYRNVGPVGDNNFIVSREGEPQAIELTNENILKIVLNQCTDLEVNTLVWKCLGYRFVNGQWNAEQCFPKWKDKYPTPPDLIGMQRIYSPEIDKPSLRANQALVKSIPVDNKQSLKLHLKPLGWKGYQYTELTPNKTRRAQCANWLIFYREELFGYTVDELRQRRQLKQQQQQQQTQANNQDEWKPPVREVY